MHRDVDQVGDQLVRHPHLNPASRYPRIFRDLPVEISNPQLCPRAYMPPGYASMRFC